MILIRWFGNVDFFGGAGGWQGTVIGIGIQDPSWKIGFLESKSFLDPSLFLFKLIGFVIPVPLNIRSSSFRIRF